MQKRNIAFSIFLICIMLCSVIAENSAVSESKEGKGTFLFRHIPWGSKYELVASELEDDGFQLSSGEITKGKIIDALIIDRWADYYDYDCNFFVSSVYGSSIPQVAGYDVKKIILYFAFTPNNEGVIDHDPSNTSLYFAQYIIKPVDLDGVYKDMREKLSSLYGKPNKQTSDGAEGLYLYNYSYWYGSDDTMIVLASEYQDMNEDLIYISYVWNKGEELSKEANALLLNDDINKEKEKFGTENTDGL